MKALTEYITNTDNLLPASLTATSVILITGFVLAQILEYSFPQKPDEQEEKMKIMELIKLEFKPIAPKTQARKSPQPSRRISKPKVERSRAEKEVKPEPKQNHKKPVVDVAALMSGFDAKKLLFDKNPSARKSLNQQTDKNTPTIDTELSSTLENHNLGDFTQTIKPAFSTMRKEMHDGGSINSIKVGKGSGVRVTRGLSGDALAGVISPKTTRANNRGSAGATISIPVPSKTANGATIINLHDLIQWMKRHPGKIPTLVEYELDHKRGDLSSYVVFKVKGRQFHLFLSCDETELQLRICLIENYKFTLLKDNGIREKSNFLTTGTVTRQGNQIHSLVSSRQAPRQHAAVFYGIFWNWWQGQKNS